MDSDQDPVKAYVDSVIAAAAGSSIISIILFGSAATGGHLPQTSDVDLILVLADGTPTAPILARVKQLEPHRTGIDAFVDRLNGTDHSCFVCTRQDLLRADIARILNISPAQAAFVDRTVLPSILSSARTIVGEDLLPSIQTPDIRRLDVAKSWFGQVSQLLTSLAIYPITPNATKFAMGAVKRGIHNCYFVHHRQPAPLKDEIEFFGPNPCFTKLLALRQHYQPSFTFILRALPTLTRLYLSTALAKPRTQ